MEPNQTERARPTPRKQHVQSFERVVVATDFSASGAAAIARAGQLPLAQGASVGIVHVLPATLPTRVEAEAERAAHEELGKLAESLAAAFADRGRRDVHVGPHLCRGRAYVEIIRYARSWGAELVVLGRHGRQPLHDLFLGSTAKRVIRAGDLPTLVVSRNATKRYERPLFALGLMDTDRAVVATALRALGPEVGPVAIVHAYQVPFERFLLPMAHKVDDGALRSDYRKAAAAGLAKLTESLEGYDVRWETALVHGDPRVAIHEEVARREADLLALGTHARSGIAHALVGSVSEALIEAGACDVLVARPARVSFELP